MSSVVWGGVKLTKLWVIHGPNLNLLGQRDRAHYGALITLDDINHRILAHAKTKNIDCEIFQFNAEVDIINQIPSR